VLRRRLRFAAQSQAEGIAGVAVAALTDDRAHRALYGLTGPASAPLLAS
jgi:hypothetical protein